MSETNKDRPDWATWALMLAGVAASRSEHPNPAERVGACALSADRVRVAVGYNNPPAGHDIDWTDREQRRHQVIHAEVNCLRGLTPGSVDLMVVTMRPCVACLAHIASHGIKCVHYLNEYDKDDGAQKAAAAMGIQLIRMSAAAQVNGKRSEDC